MRKYIFNAIQITSFIAGVALFVYLVASTGVPVLINNLEKLGWGFVLIIALSGARNFVRAASWYAAIEPDQREISFLRLTNVVLAGEAIKYLTATGPILGEPAKAAMIRRDIPLLQGFSSVLIENLIYYLTVFVFMFAGLPALVRLAEAPGNVKLIAYGVMALIAIGVGLIWLAIRYRWYVLARGLEQLAGLTSRRSPLWFRRLNAIPLSKNDEKESGTGRLETLASQVRLVEDNLYTFYERRRGTFYLIFCLNMGSHLMNVVEVYLILLLLQLPSNLVFGFLAEAVTKIINFVFFFVPTRAGVYESGNALLLQSLGMSAAAGVALAIVRKLRAFVWAGYGLIIIATAAFKKEG